MSSSPLSRAAAVALTLVTVLCLSVPVMSAIAPVADASPVFAGTYTPISPTRVLDTRIGQGAPLSRLGPGASLKLGLGSSIPAGASAVVLNVTAVAPSAATHLVVWPGTGGVPPTSSLNVAAGETRANLVTVGVAPDASVTIRNNAGTVDMVADLEGYYGTSPLGGATMFHPVVATRILDTRAGARIGPGAVFIVKVTDIAGVPADATAAVVNITAVNPSVDTHLTAYPFDLPVPPTASNVNGRAGTVTPNLAVVALGSGGDIKIRNQSGTVDVVVDLSGYYSPGIGLQFQPITPWRALDTRGGPPPPAGIGPKTSEVCICATGVAVPADSTQLVGNLTGIAGVEPTHLTVNGTNNHTVSNLNLASGQTAAVGFYSDLSPTGCLHCGLTYVYNNSGHTNAVLDVTGYFYSSV